MVKDSCSHAVRRLESDRGRCCVKSMTGGGGGGVNNVYMFGVAVPLSSFGVHFGSTDVTQGFRFPKTFPSCFFHLDGRESLAPNKHEATRGSLLKGP